VIITEFMADPEPAISLPEHEYIELFNRTDRRLLLKGIVLADARNNVVIPSGIINPGERVLLTKTSAVEDLSNYGKTIGVPNWPSLNNAADEIMILDTGMQVIHHLDYTNYWYDNDEKKDGGWSLELIDEASFCSGDKVWSASISSLGGTPGSVNSNQFSLPDLSKPRITEAFALTNDSIIIRFDESLTNQLPVITNSPLPVLSLNYTDFGRDELILHVAQLQARTRYEFTVGKILDCAGNISDEEKALVILPEEAERGDVLLSEILFNPRTNGVDFIEVFNDSDKYISLLGWSLSNGISSVDVPASNVLKPYSYQVFSDNPTILIAEYPKAIIDNVLTLNLPSLPNEEGKVVLVNKYGQTQDSIAYNESWHFPYLSSVDGISLERIDFSQPTHLANNWASAAATDYFATPGYKNSQSKAAMGGGKLTILPQVIVPNDNGIDDITTIHLSQTGSMVSIIIYNLRGQPIKQIANNTLVGSSSAFTWDGTNSTGAMVPLGHYIIVANIISAEGRTKIMRGKIVVGTGY
jgi:hypothetical protein